MGDIAKQYSVYVGMTYLNWVDDNKTASNGMKTSFLKLKLKTNTIILSR